MINSNKINDVKNAIDIILHHSLYEYKVQNSKHVLSINNSDHDKKGAIAVYRSKNALKHGHGVVVTSKEALYDNIDAYTHWTPNPRNWLSYTDKTRQTLTGTTTDNLQQINAFVIDIDFVNQQQKDLLTNSIAEVCCLDLGLSNVDLPTMILDTDRGYQVYYVLDQPAFVRKTKQGTYPVIDVAQKISRSLKDYLRTNLPQVDLNCGSLGVFRMPRTDNLLWFDPNSLYKFADLIDWSQDQVNQRSHQLHIVKNLPKVCQVKQAWYQKLIHCSQINGDHSVLGRHNAIFTLALANYSSQVKLDDALKTLLAFNAELINPLHEKEVINAVQDAYSGRFKGAQKQYIDALLTYWCDDQSTTTQSVDYRVWHKFAKSRQDRKYSHLFEWKKDIIQYLNQKLHEKDELHISQRDLQRALGISAASLNRALKALRSDNQLIVKSGAGNHKAVMLTLSALIEQLSAHKADLSVAWYKFLKKQLTLLTETKNNIEPQYYQETLFSSRFSSA